MADIISADPLRPAGFSHAARRRLAVAFILVLVLGFILATGAVRSGAGYASGFGLGAVRSGAGVASSSGLRGTPAVQPSTRPTLRIATFNIHSGVGLDNRMDLSRIAASLRGFDVVGLNEVRGRALFGDADQAQQLGTLLSMPNLFAPAERRWWHDSFGNAALSNLPVVKWERQPLSHGLGRGYKNVLTLNTSFAGRPLCIMVTHIDREDDRMDQLSDVIEQFAQLPYSAILMGDFNTRPGDSMMQEILSSPAASYAMAYGARRMRPPVPNRFYANSNSPSSDIIDPFANHNLPDRVDWILLRGLTLRDCGVIETSASDHPIVWAEIEAK